MKPGRNDPCLCGSGKKYKNCCLVAERQRAEAAQELTLKRVRRAIDGVGRTLGAFVMEQYGRAAVEQAWDEFMAWDGPASCGLRRDAVLVPRNPALRRRARLSHALRAHRAGARGAGARRVRVDAGR
jgi:hypothetical protein